jgi:hypothetical protein
MVCSVVLSLAASALAGIAADAPVAPFPSDYREWIFLSSGLGMTYGPPAATSQAAPLFDNVFVNRTGYAGFLKSGSWPDGTFFVLEVRSSESKRSINQGGHFQSGVVGTEGEMKKNGEWTFYSFNEAGKEGKPFARTANCYSCHRANGAVDNTFVQFYPTLPVAREKGRLRPEK